ncbi:hypothetical protein [Pedobacter heparinus]|uniref:Uncharacterized protein n=1 Tax=Pedobacter heparinus (strain ATCC 13125 / DSM 2366 / CIP 104194 / JCM 7457 / NBRC 12017 / NCIMB 9290 / NRRL B-14731 / HIM 762-3) TaxID=485917 RepID=C6XV66_PEDHD|nr:hypothetical protein [Pedobacter heparinus]ACU03932.1 hypothetical protein Phep_1721 [Pedobacter heparinus DSM 2366]
MSEEKKNTGSLLSGQEPHQKEDFDQAERASAASFELDPDKGITPDPEEYNQGDEQGNIKQMPKADHVGSGGFDPVNANPDLDAGASDVTTEDLKSLDALDRDH